MFPALRLRRLRQTSALRKLTQETRLSREDFMAPFFVAERASAENSITRQHDLKSLLKSLDGYAKKGGLSILLFGVPYKKDSKASQAYASGGITQKALKEIKKQFGDDLAVATDLCFCSYTDHGHCGILNGT